MISDRVRIIIVHICLFLVFFLPIYSWSQYLLALIPLILYISVSDKKIYKGWNYIAIVCLCLSLLFNGFWLIPDYFKSIIKTVNLCILFALFPYFKNNGIYIRTNFVVMMICLVLFTQFVWILGITPLIQLFDTIYPPTISYGKAGVNFTLNIGGRYGGIFHNPNDCARNIIILSSIYLVMNNRNKRTDIITLLIVTVSVYLTGSRTGVIMLLTTFFIYICNMEGISILKKTNIISIVAIMALLFYIFILGDNTRLKTLEFNPTKSDRMYWLLEAINNIMQNPFSALFGRLYQERMSFWKIGFAGGFDSDIGNIIYSYGFSFIFTLLIFLYSQYKRIGCRFFYCIPPHIVMAGTGLFTNFYSSIMIFFLYAICFIESERIIELSKLRNTSTN